MKEIHFKSYDYIDLSGILVKNKENAQTDKVMLFVSGKSSNATGNLKYINEIRGFTENIDFLSINLRYHDPSTGGFLRGTTLGVKEAFDVVGAINTLAEMGYTKVVVYGYSIGGAATINALGKYSNLLSKEIKVEGIIVEKTYANLRELLERSHGNLFSNLGVSAVAPFVGAKEFFPKVLPVSVMQTDLSIKLGEKIGGFEVSGNDPAETIKNINVPVIVIGSEHGDIFTTENDAEILANNARHSKLIIAKNGSTSLIERHSPEFDNTIVIGSMIQFVNSLL